MHRIITPQLTGRKFSDMPIPLLHIWILGMAITHTTRSESAWEGLGHDHRQLLDVSRFNARIDLNITPCGGRCIPWPTTLNTGTSMNQLTNEEFGARNKPYESEPHMTLEANEGEAVTISSGVGQWARPTEATWSCNRRLWWQHEPDQPDWTDYQVEGRFKINSNYDLTLQKTSLRDSGRYTARFRLQPKGTVYIMETSLTVYRHPPPKILAQGLQPGARRLTLWSNTSSTVLKCEMIRTHPKVVLSWERNSQPVPEAEITRENTTDTATQILKVTQADNGSLITCAATNAETTARKTATIAIRAMEINKVTQAYQTPTQITERATTKQQTVQQTTQKEGNHTNTAPTAAELGNKHEKSSQNTTAKLTTYLLLAVALSAATIGTTLAIISKCNSRPRGATYHLTRTVNPQ